MAIGDRGLGGVASLLVGFVAVGLLTVDRALTRQRGPSAWQVVNALIGFVQEHRAGKAIQALAQLVSEPARVRRDRRWTQVGADALVPGDVVSLEAGAAGRRGPADPAGARTRRP